MRFRLNDLHIRTAIQEQQHNPSAAFSKFLRVVSVTIGSIKSYYHAQLYRYFFMNQVLQTF